MPRSALPPLSRDSRFLVLGRAGMDLYADPPGTEAESAATFASALGGSSANIAAGLARHGLAASLLTCVSDDAVGRFVRNELERYGVDARHLHVLQGETRTSLAVTETRIDNTQTTLYRNNASDLLLTGDQVDEVPFDTFDVLIVTGTALATEPSRSATLRAMRLAGAARALVVIDLDYRPYSWSGAEEAAGTYREAIALADMIVGNDEEFAVVAGGSLQAGRALAADTGQGGKTALYKKGEKGSVVFAPGGTFETGIFRVRALKPMGAGDAFLSSLMASLAAGHSLKDAVLRGSAAAAMVVSRFGCAPAMPTSAALDEFMNQHSATRA